MPAAASRRTLIIGMRDFDFLLEDRAHFVPRHAHTDDPNEDNILFDVWDGMTARRSR